MSAGTTTPHSPRNILLRAHLNTHCSGCMTTLVSPPYHICIVNSRPRDHRLSVRSTHCLSCDAAICVFSVWLVHWPALSALYGALGLFPGSRWLLWGPVTFALMLWLWWPFRGENILASQTRVVSLNNGLQLLYVHCVLYVWNWIGRIMKIYMLLWCEPWPRLTSGFCQNEHFPFNSEHSRFIFSLN